MIYHVVTAVNWQKSVQQGFYEADSLVVEGFIHTSKADQVKGVLERYYKGQNDLLLKYELAPSVNDEFPHIYGRLNIDAVTKVEKI